MPTNKIDGKINMTVYKDGTCKTEIRNLTKTEISACILALVDSFTNDFPDMKPKLFLGLFELI